MGKAKARMDEFNGRARDEMPQVVFEPRAFSEAKDVIAKGSAGRAAGGLRRKQPAAG